MWTVYSLHCAPTDRLYIGCTRNYQTRIASHLRELRKSSHSNQALTGDFIAHGENAFQIRVLSIHRTKARAFNEETKMIKALAKNGRLYNVSHVVLMPIPQSLITKIPFDQLTDLVTLKEAASIAGISSRMMQVHIDQGTAPRYGRIGREVAFLREEVLQWGTLNYPTKRSRKGRKKAA